jgi:SAM-dependent methyltransferase
MASGCTGTVLDVGCGTSPYRELFAQSNYIGIEVVLASNNGSSKRGADALYDGRSLPFADASIDNILCNQVLEHVFEPAAFLSELHRVLRPGGRLMMTVPFVWDEHEQPYDFARYSSFGLAHLTQRCGFQIVQARRTLADASLFAQLWLAYCFKVIIRTNRNSLARKVAIASVCVPVNIAGLILQRFLPSNQDLYLDNAVILTRLPEEVAG